MVMRNIIINPQETQQVVARDEKWVPFTERVKISSTNVRLETTVQQKEETFQVFIEVIKNTTCFKAFTITAEVRKIFMQQFWYTIKKVKDSKSYEFLLANKKCIVDAEVFRKILDICPRVKGEEFTEVQDDDATLTFLIDLGYKGPLHKYTNMYVDHMHQSWRTLAAIINKCLSRKTASNDKLRKSRINIEYGLPIPDMMLKYVIKQSESYQMFLKYSTGQIPPKKSRVKARKRTTSRRVVKKKITISIADNIIPDPNVTLELGKSISLTEATEEEATKEEAARKVHATHARIVTESEPEPAKKKTGSRSTRGVVIQDTSSALKPKPTTLNLKLKGVQSLTPEEQEAIDIMQAIKENESTFVPATSSEGTGTKPGVPNKEKVTSEEDQCDDKEVNWIDSDEDEEKKDDTDDDKSINLEMTDDEETDDEFVHDDEQVNEDKDEEMLNAEVEDSRKCDA
ncbi:hypothetical protein Tco_0983134 [Tanacetum coccineum]